MTDEKLHSQITYDFTKVITDISLNPAYIHGLQRICNEMIVNSDRGAEMPTIFKKFENIINQNTKPIEDQKPVQLDVFESNIYTIFSLIQLFKYHAKKQDLEIETETTVKKSELAALAKLVENGEDITDALADINSQMTVVK